MWYETGFCDVSIWLIFPRSSGLGVYKVFYIKPRIYQSGKPAVGSCQHALWFLMFSWWCLNFVSRNVTCICRDRDHSITTCIFPWKQLNKEWSLKPLIYPFWFVSQYRYKDDDTETHFLFVFQMKKKSFQIAFLPRMTSDSILIWVHENLHLCINVKTPQIAPVCKCQQIMKYENIYVFQIRC